MNDVIPNQNPIYEFGPHEVINGEKWWKFFSEYTLDGKKFSFYFHARDTHEATRLLQAIKETSAECFQCTADNRQSAEEILVEARGIALFLRSVLERTSNPV